MRSTTASKSRPPRRAFLALFVIAAVLTASATIYLAVIVIPCLSHDISLRPSVGPVKYLDRDGTALAVENRWAVGDEIPPLLLELIVRQEDERFWSRSGPFDAEAIARAIVKNIGAKLAGKKERQGASTLGQQVSRNLRTPLPSGKARTLRRKIEEAAVAWRLTKYSKPELLEAYVNLVPIGPWQGLPEASIKIYGRPLSKLNDLEQLNRVRMIPAPSARCRPGDARKNLETGVRALQSSDALDPTLQLPAQLPLRFAKPAVPQNKAWTPALENEVRREGERLKVEEKLKAWSSVNTLTVDADLQIEEQQIVVRHFAAFKKRMPAAKRDDLRVGMVALVTASAEIGALVGGANPAVAGWSTVTRAERPINSIIKPLESAAPLSTGRMAIDSLVLDWPIKDGWPRNAGRGYLGWIPLWRALVESRNAPFPRFCEDFRPEIDRFFRSVGFRPLKPGTPEQFLGSYEATLLQLGNAYTTIGTRGIFRPATLIKQVYDAENPGRIARVAADGVRVMPQETADDLLATMHRAMLAGGTGAGLPDDLPGGCKTGTGTGDLHVVYTDAWVTVVVWIGTKDRKTPLWNNASSADLAGFATDAIRAARRHLAPQPYDSTRRLSANSLNR